jgi:hypothetical protein
MLADTLGFDCDTEKRSDLELSLVAGHAATRLAWSKS